MTQYGLLEYQVCKMSLTVYCVSYEVTSMNRGEKLYNHAMKTFLLLKKGNSFILCVCGIYDKIFSNDITTGNT